MYKRLLWTGNGVVRSNQERDKLGFPEGENNERLH
nr:MAG TPA: hypothetical protein [Caudoviricetes sp.]